MHRDDLAALGESLRRELGDLLGGDVSALAELRRDAARLTDTLDSQSQALTAWLIGGAVAPELPPDSALPTEPTEAVDEVSPRQRATSLPTDNASRAASASIPAAEPPSSPAGFAPALPENPTSSRRAVFPPDRASTVTAASSLTTTPPIASESDGGQSNTSLETVGAHLRLRPPMPIYPPTEPSHIQTPPPIPVRAFTPVKNLHDLAQKIATETPDGALPLGGELTSDDSAGRVNVSQNVVNRAQIAANRDQISRASLDPRLARDTSPDPSAASAQPTPMTQVQGLAALASSLKTLTFAPEDDTQQVPSEQPVSPVVTRTQIVQMPPSSVSAAANSLPSLSANEGIPDPDLDDLLDAIAHSITAEYKRFYGS